MSRFFDGLVLGIETSCDETSASLISGRTILSNVVASQTELHKRWGGVVPEAAARAHVEAIVPVLAEALDGQSPAAIAVTNRPGLVGALSVGVTAAKALSLAKQVPLIGVHHLEGHILSVFGAPGVPVFPHVALVVSGGHTETVLVTEPGGYRLIGQTLDDAAGEAFDKGARLLGLGYPGGRAIEEQAATGDPKRYKLPRGLDRDLLNFSYSGLKTAVLRLVEKEGSRINVPDAAASLQRAIVSSLVAKCLNAAENSEVNAVSLVGGVAANQELRQTLGAECSRRGWTFMAPPLDLCTDNAAMIALAGSIRIAKGERSGMHLDCLANSPLPGLEV